MVAESKDGCHKMHYGSFVVVNGYIVVFGLADETGKG